MKLVCPHCGHHDIFTEHMLSGVWIRRTQLEQWICFDCGFQGVKDDFVPRPRRRMHWPS